MKKFTNCEKIHILSLHRSCENSSYHLSKVKSFLLANNYQIKNNIDGSDIVIINTCAYTDDMINNNKDRISRIITKHPGKKFIVFGCLVNFLHNTDQMLLKDIINVNNINELSRLFEHKVQIDSCYVSNLSYFDSYQLDMGVNDNYIMISQGCINNCTYCNIKTAKGFVKSVPLFNILDQASNIINKGHFVLTLLSDDCGSYGKDIQSDLSTLIDELLLLDSRVKIKLYTLFPSYLINNYPKLKNHIRKGRITYICVPLQSGSDKVLKLMNRGYDLSKLKEVINEVKSDNSEIHLFTHFIINFPSESMSDFKKSLELAELFDFNLFLHYKDNINTRSHLIKPKCSESDLKMKIEMLEDLIHSDKLRGNIIC